MAGRRRDTSGSHPVEEVNGSTALVRRSCKWSTRALLALGEVVLCMMCLRGMSEEA